MNSYNKHILCFSLYLVLFFDAQQAKCDPRSSPSSSRIPVLSTSLRASLESLSHSAVDAAKFDSDLFEWTSPAPSIRSVQARSPVAHSPASSPKSFNHLGQASPPHDASVPSASLLISATPNGRIPRQSTFTRSPSSSPKPSEHLNRASSSFDASVPSGSQPTSTMSLAERMKKKLPAAHTLTQSIHLGKVSSAPSPISVTPVGGPQEQNTISHSPAPSPKSSSQLEQAFSSLGASTMSLFNSLKKRFTGTESPAVSPAASLKSSNHFDQVSVPSSEPTSTVSLTETLKNKFTGAHSPASSPKSSIHLHKISRLLRTSSLSSSKPISTSTESQTTSTDLPASSPESTNEASSSLYASAPSVSRLVSLTRSLRKRRTGVHSPASSPKSSVHPPKVSRVLTGSVPSTSHSTITHPPVSSPKSSIRPHKVSRVLPGSVPSTSHSTVTHPPVSSPKSSVHPHKFSRVHPHKVSWAHPHKVSRVLRASAPSTSHSAVTHAPVSSPKSSIHLLKVSRLLHTSVPSTSQSTVAYPPASSPKSFDHFEQAPSPLVSLPPLSSPQASLVTDPAIKEICGKTAYPDLCLSSVSLYLKTSKVQNSEIQNDPISVLEMVINAAVQHTNLALKFAYRKATDAEQSSSASTFEELKENYSDALYSYSGAINAINNKDISTLKMRLSAALDDFSQYEDNHGQRSPLADRDTKLAQMTTNALNIASMVNNIQ